jgi:hypothetical protein
MLFIPVSNEMNMALTLYSLLLKGRIDKSVKGMVFEHQYVIKRASRGKTRYD